MLPLADLGFHVIAPDQRGYGRTTGWSSSYQGDLAPFGLINLVEDAATLIASLGYASAASVVGHDFGSAVAAYCGLIKSEIFQSVVMMSAPFEGSADEEISNQTDESIKQDIDRALAALRRPRKHYQKYYCCRTANNNMRHCCQGIGAFLRAYFYYKSADWEGNAPVPLKAWRASELALMPTYYIMNLAVGMAETVAEYMPSEQQIANCSWLPEKQLKIYAEEFGRTGFQGGLQWYRCGFDERQIGQLRNYSNQSIDIPSCFIGGEKDWGVFQKPGAYEKMQSRACTKMYSCDLVANAGHWVQQEQPEKVVELLSRFITQLPDNPKTNQFPG